MHDPFSSFSFIVTRTKQAIYPAVYHIHAETDFNETSNKETCNINLLSEKNNEWILLSVLPNASVSDMENGIY